MNEHDHLITRLLEEELNAEEIQALVIRLEKNPSLHAQLGQQAAMHGLLGPLMEDERETQLMIDRFRNAALRADAAQFTTQVRRRISKTVAIRRISWASAALLLLAAILFVFVHTPEILVTVARIESQTDQARFKPGDMFHRDDRLRLKAGFMEIDLDGRGRMIVEGPADLQFLSPTAAVLRNGRVVLRINPKGHGYQLHTPQGNIVDLGTEFGVLVDEQTGQVETHILKGRVKAVSKNGARTLMLRENEALQQSGGKTTNIPMDRGSFYTSLPPLRKAPLCMVHWDMESSGSSVQAARVRGFSDKDLAMKFMRKGHSSPPTGLKGPFGTAIRFDGNSVYGESGFKGISGGAPRTVAFWARVPSDFDPKQGFSMISWGEWSDERPGSVWQISINPLAGDGPIGRLRIGVHGGMAIGNTDLRDDLWHHVAVVLYPAENPDIGQHVMLYLDGELETISRRVLGTIDTRTDGATHGVWLGRNITEAAESGLFFRGALDEVYIFNAALSQKEIRTLMRNNEPPR